MDATPAADAGARGSRAHNAEPRTGCSGRGRRSERAAGLDTDAELTRLCGKVAGPHQFGFAITRSRELLLVALLAAIALTRVVTCYPVFSQTYDEPMHIAAGLEWLDQGIYTLAIQNPPLTRILEALGPRWDGARFERIGSPIAIGNLALYGGGDYVRRLSLARLGNLPLLLIAIAAVALWGRRATGSAAGSIVAVLLFSTIPAVLGHAGVATGDLGCVTGFAVLIVAAMAWLDDPRLARAALVGIALGFAILLKFLTVLFFLPAFLAIALLRVRDRGTIPWRTTLRDATCAALIGSFLIWAGYRFTVVPAARLPELVLPDSPFLPALSFLSRAHVPLPAGEFIAAILTVAEMNRRSTYPSFFLGRVDIHGHTLFYPTVFAIKTPLPLLALLACALALLVTRWRNTTWLEMSGVVAFATILLSSFLIHIDGGIRYILPVYAAAAVAGTTAAVAIWRWRPRAGPAVVVLLIASQITASAAIHPDYLADFNLLAGAHPERIVIDSDLDWGQDLFRLADAAHEMGIRELSVAYFGTADPRQHNLAPVVHELPPGRRVTGWIAISEVLRAPIWTDGYRWLAAYRPVRKAGKSIVMYYVPR